MEASRTSLNLDSSLFTLDSYCCARMLTLVTEVGESMTLIRVAHSPDSDDAFMFYALAKGLIDTGDLGFEHVLSDIESLNREAFDGTYEVTAVSIHAYAHLDDRYALLGSGASMEWPPARGMPAASHTARPPRITSRAISGASTFTGQPRMAIAISGSPPMA